jgi:hypothetical protein
MHHTALPNSRTFTFGERPALCPTPGAAPYQKGPPAPRRGVRNGARTRSASGKPVCRRGFGLALCLALALAGLTAVTASWANVVSPIPWRATTPPPPTLPGIDGVWMAGMRGP